MQRDGRANTVKRKWEFILVIDKNQDLWRKSKLQIAGAVVLVMVYSNRTTLVKNQLAQLQALISYFLTGWLIDSVVSVG